VRAPAKPPSRDASAEHAERKRQAADQRKHDQKARAVRSQIADLEATIADRERAMKEIETAMSAPGFYDNREIAQPLVDRHQTLMWELGELMHRWEALQK
jgi:hypothetical protein